MSSKINFIALHPYIRQDIDLAPGRPNYSYAFSSKILNVVVKGVSRII